MPEGDRKEKQEVREIDPVVRENMQRELDGPREHGPLPNVGHSYTPPGLYDRADLQFLQNVSPNLMASPAALQTVDDLLQRDEQREKDGFPRRIRIGRMVKPSQNKKRQFVVVPTTTEPKFYHDMSRKDDEEATGGSGEGEEGEILGEQPMDQQEGEDGMGAGQGQGAEHDVTSNAFDLGKILTEKFQLPNLKAKGKKRSFTKYVYDLTDRHRGFGQVLDKKETLKKVIQTNALLGNVTPEAEVSTEDLLINPMDEVYRVFSREKDFETQAIVFFLRDYSGSMEGKPTEVIATQHLFIYSWLVYQYKNNVVSRFIVHDTEAKEVPDFYTYYNSQVAGGTNVYPAYNLVSEIIEKEQLARDYNIYVFHGTDGDDWDSVGEKAVNGIKNILRYTNRMGLTIARNSWGNTGETTVERYVTGSGLLKERPELFKMDSMIAAEASEGRIIEGIRRLTE
jgi:uncharacterized sporulation protein YeaH/YhbH (DUF444 family)